MTLPDEILDHAAAGRNVVDVELVDHGWHHQQRYRPHLVGLRCVKDQLKHLIAKHHRPGGGGHGFPSVNASDSTIDGSRGRLRMSVAKCRSPRTTLSPPVSIAALYPAGLTNGILLGASPSVTKSS